MTVKPGTILYKTYQTNFSKKNFPEIKNILAKLKEHGYINEKQETYLMGPDDPRPRYFYLIPTIPKKQKS